MPPDSIDADPKSLPHSFRGYDRRATEELFRRVAWDYAVLAGEHRKLKENGDAARPHTGAARANPDDEAHSLLAAAHRAARELRESTRAECEQALRKANRRSAEIELEAERTCEGRPCRARGRGRASRQPPRSAGEARGRRAPGHPTGSGGRRVSRRRGRVDVDLDVDLDAAAYAVNDDDGSARRRRSEPAGAPWKTYQMSSRGVTQMTLPCQQIGILNPYWAWNGQCVGVASS